MMRRMSANNHRGQEVKIFHKQAGYMRAMIFFSHYDQISCKRSGFIYGAGWHTDDTALTFDNITLVRLPAYSPELNPVEQIWQWLRDNELANKCFAGYEDIVNSCCNAWNSFISGLERVKNICMREWMDLGV